MKKLCTILAAVLFIVPFLSAASSAPNLNFTYLLNTTPQYIPGQLIIKLKDTVTVSTGGISTSSIGVSSLDNLNLRHGATSEKLLKTTSSERLDKLYVLKFPKGSDIKTIIAEYKNDPDIEYAEPNYIVRILPYLDGGGGGGGSAGVYPNDPGFSQLWGLHNTGQTGGTAGADIDALDAWNITTGSPNVVVGVIDTGIDYNHPDLAANMWINPVDGSHGYNFVTNTNDPMDDYGHGTHCAGTIGAVGNNSIGVVGVNWKVKIAALKFLDDTGSGTDEDAIRAINYANQMGFKILSNSWGGGGNSQALLDAINAAGANNTLFIFAAGNSGTNNDWMPAYPCSYDTPYILCVAATDSNDQLAYFSNYGAITVDIAAPGLGVYSTVPGNNYATYSGTSMATPHVTGVAALIKSEFPTLNNTQIKNRILCSSDHISSLKGVVLSNGRLNASRAVMVDNIPPVAVSNLNGMPLNPNAITLSWTAVGDDGMMGTAALYDIRYSFSPITPSNFDSAKRYWAPVPKAAGSAEALNVSGLDSGMTYYFAMKVYDKVGNPSPLSNLASVSTTSPPLPPGCDHVIVSNGNPAVLDLSNSRYCLLSDLTTSTNGVIDTSTYNTTFDCRGFNINGGGVSGGTSGVQVINGENNKVKNCRVTNFRNGIYLLEAPNSTITNNTAYNNYVGFWADSSSNSVFMNNTENSSTASGFWMLDSSNSTIVNNVAKNHGSLGAGFGFVSVNGGVDNNIIINNTALNGDVGFYLYPWTNATNNVISNDYASGNNYGFYMREGYSNNFTSITSYKNGYGLYVQYGWGYTVTNSIFQDNTQYGVYLDQTISYDPSALPNQLYNNLFNNTDGIFTNNAMPSFWYKEYWNTTKRSGVRVYPPGNQIGGNYWTNSSGLGCSDICDDTDSDGFCDLSCFPAGGNPYAFLPTRPNPPYTDDLPYSARKTTLTQSVTPASGSYAPVTATFSCNYSNSSGAPVTGATVLVLLSGTSYTATYNSAARLYQAQVSNLGPSSYGWYCTVSKSGYHNQTGSYQSYIVSSSSGGGGGGGGRHYLMEPTQQMPVGDTWTIAVIIVAILGLCIGYFILKEVLTVSTTRPRKKRK
jgi:parallel beta-helix repeat protein